MNIQKMQAFLFFMGKQTSLTMYHTPERLSENLPKADSYILVVTLKKDGAAYQASYRSWNQNRYNGNNEVGPSGEIRVAEAELISCMREDVSLAAEQLYDEWKRGARLGAIQDILRRTE